MSNKKNYLLLFVALIIMGLTVSAVTAVDDTNTTNDMTTSNVVKTVEPNNIETTPEVNKAKSIKKVNSESNEVKSASTYYVSTNGKSSNTGTETSPYDLTTAFKQIKNDKGGNLIINGGTYKISSMINLNTAGTYTIKGKLGATVKIDGQNKYRILSIGDNINIEITNIVFQNAKATDWGNNGGALYITQSGKKVIDNCSFINNQGAYGAAIYSKADNFKVINSIFTNNKATAGGAAISNMGNSAIFSDNTFTQNTAAKEGAAINNNGNKVTITDNVFKSNSAESGVAINNHKGSNVKIINNEFIQNTAKKNGGAITINEATAVDIKSNTFTKNVAEYDGAAICVYGNSNIQITNNEFKENIAKRTGGALYTQGNSVTFSNNLVSSNVAYRTGGAVYDQGSNFKVLNNEFTGNVVHIKSDNIGDGAAAYIRGSKPTVQGNKIINNKAEGSGGAVYLDTGGSATLTKNVFIKNQAGKNGGAVFTRGANNKITYNNFTMNTAKESSKPAIKDYGTGTTSSNNKNAATSAYNGTVYNVGNKVTISNNIFEDKIIKQTTKVSLNKITTKVYNDTITITGKLTDNTNAVIKNAAIKINFNGKKYSVKTNNNGVYTQKLNLYTVGKNNITVSFAGNEYYKASSTKSTFTVNKRATKISLNKITGKFYNDSTIITGKLVNNKNVVLKNAAIKINFNGKKYSVKTNNNGVYTCKVTVTKVGTNNVTVSYAGNKNYKANSNKTTFNVYKKETKISVNKISQKNYKDKVTISGKLVNKDNVVIKYAAVKVKVNTKTYNVKTNVNGVFTYTITTYFVGTNNVTVSFAGNDNYKAISNKTTFKTINKD